MKKSQRSEDKSIYLAFALSPSISFEFALDRESSQDRKFHFELSNETIDKTSTFGLDSMKKQNEMYLYLSLPQYVQKLTEKYSIKLIDESFDEPDTLLDQKINLDNYIHEHNTQQRDFWTQIFKTSNQTDNIIIKQRVFLKRTKFELQDIINSSEIGEQYDVVDIPESTQKTSKFGIDRRKSKSYQFSVNSLISPKRLDTISEEDSTIPLTQKKQRESFGENKTRPQRLSASFKKSDDFQHELQKRSTWIQQSGQFDNEFASAFYEKKYSQNQKGNLREEKGIPTEFDQLKLKPITEIQMSQKGCKISKHSKDSEKQGLDNSISFLEKSSLLMDMSHSELDISPDDQIYFKLKWIILVVVVLGLAILASLSADAFDINREGKQKSNGYKKKGEKLKTKSSKSSHHKEKKQIHV